MNVEVCLWVAGIMCFFMKTWSTLHIGKVIPSALTFFRPNAGGPRPRQKMILHRRQIPFNSSNYDPLVQPEPRRRRQEQWESQRDWTDDMGKQYEKGEERGVTPSCNKSARAASHKRCNMGKSNFIFKRWRKPNLRSLSQTFSRHGRW